VVRGSLSARASSKGGGVMAGLGIAGEISAAWRPRPVPNGRVSAARGPRVAGRPTARACCPLAASAAPDRAETLATGRGCDPEDFAAGSGIPSAAADLKDVPAGHALEGPLSEELRVVVPELLGCASTFVRRSSPDSPAHVTVEARCLGVLDADGDVLALKAAERCVRDVRRAKEKAQLAVAGPAGADAHGERTRRIREDLLSILKTGEVVASEPVVPSGEQGFQHEGTVFRVRLQRGRDGAETNAIFKARVQGEGCGWHRVQGEVEAYGLSRLLGVDLVPPAVLRRNVLGHELGIMMLWCNNLHELRVAGDVGLADLDPEWFGYVDEWSHELVDCRSAINAPSTVSGLLSDVRVLDVLLSNSDSHRGHYLVGDAWDPRAPGDRRLYLIDHSASFREGAFVSCVHENAFGTGPIRKVRAPTLRRLRLFSAETAAAAMGETVSYADVKALALRRDYLLEYFDGLIAKLGKDAVLLP